ncbi:MAG: hypothetical protein JJU00_18785 [Opitutales bacterium]|nr:hypothetical protein [Opitutales bacterium]
MKTAVFFPAAAALLSAAALPAAVVITDISEPAAEAQFADAVDAAELVFIGRESFPSLGEGTSGTTTGAQLAPGVPAGTLFPSGSNTSLGLFFQTNSLGGNPAALNPGGTLYATGPFPGDSRAWLGPNLASNSLDIIVDPPAYRGQIHAFSFAVATTGGSPVVVRLYDSENNLQGSETLTLGDSSRTGIVLTGEPMFRVNVWAPTGFVDVGDLDLYAIPEPAAAALLAALAALWAIRRRP